MKLAYAAAFLAGCGLAAPAESTHYKRWDYDVCNNNCSLDGVAMPDQNTFQLPLENFWPEQCPPIVVGAFEAPFATSRVCLTFSGTALHFTAAPFPGYTFEFAIVGWKLMGNISDPSSWATPPPPTTNIACIPGSGGAYTCDLPFHDILQVAANTPTIGLMAGMCPKGDREALGLYLQFFGLVQPVGGGPSISFLQQLPCLARASNGTCTALNHAFTYIEVAYRCTKCNVHHC